MSAAFGMVAIPIRLLRYKLLILMDPSQTASERLRMVWLIEKQIIPVMRDSLLLHRHLKSTGDARVVGTSRLVRLNVLELDSMATGETGRSIVEH